MLYFFCRTGVMSKGEDGTPGSDDSANGENSLDVYRTKTFPGPAEISARLKSLPGMFGG
jgi:hypothetical protein